MPIIGQDAVMYVVETENERSVVMIELLFGYIWSYIGFILYLCVIFSFVTGGPQRSR